MTNPDKSTAATPVSPADAEASVNLASLSVSDLREYRANLSAEEDKVSYWRRLIHSRLDLISKQTADEPVPTAVLVKSLGQTGTGARRRQFLSVEAEEPLPMLPELTDLWSAAIDPSDVAGTNRLTEALKAAEAQLSEYRASLHRRIDAATAELIARYKADVTLTEDLLPRA